MQTSPKTSTEKLALKHDAEDDAKAFGQTRLSVRAGYTSGVGSPLPQFVWITPRGQLVPLTKRGDTSPHRSVSGSAKFYTATQDRQRGAVSRHR